MGCVGNMSSTKLMYYFILQRYLKILSKSTHWLWRYKFVGKICSILYDAYFFKNYETTFFAPGVSPSEGVSFKYLN